VAWAPHEVGCLLAAASTDGTVSLLELNAAGAQQGGQAFGQVGQVTAHALGANGVSWSPGAATGSLTGTGGASTGATKRFVTGGSDGLVKIWEVNGQEIALVTELAGHADWVRDVSWSSTVLKKSYIASASQDKTVRIWSSENGSEYLVDLISVLTFKVIGLAQLFHRLNTSLGESAGVKVGTCWP
jgi:protein transport protein SEC13